MEITVNIKDIDGTQMAAKISGEFQVDENLFPFTAIAFGRIGGQNIGAKLSAETENQLKNLGYDINEIICLLYTSPSPRDGLLSRMPSSA